MSGFGGYIRRNHLGLIAIFIALGGTTYAANQVGSSDIAKNAVRSKHIKAKQVKPGDLSPKARDGCPGGTRLLSELCVRPATSEGNYFQASDFCAARGLRVPAAGEANLLAKGSDLPGISGTDQFWTDEVWSEQPGAYTASEDDGFASTVVVSDESIKELCVIEPREGG